MTIEVEESLLHWNYFLALANDLESVSRYIEFTTSNFKTYSIELAHLLLASASEVDVVAKGICKHLEPDSNPDNINQYRDIITRHIPSFSQEQVFVLRYGLTFRPWTNWRIKEKNPLWWKSYNNVKHQRSVYFEDANLKNVLNSLGGLLIVVFYFYKLKFSSDLPAPLDNREVTMRLRPELDFLRLQPNYYYRKAFLP